MSMDGPCLVSSMGGKPETRAWGFLTGLLSGAFWEARALLQLLLSPRNLLSLAVYRSSLGLPRVSMRKVADRVCSFLTSIFRF